MSINITPHHLPTLYFTVLVFPIGLSTSDEKQDIESGEQNPEEDINLDEILQRAETHENPSDQTRADALLSRFNVAEFKTNEMAQGRLGKGRRWNDGEGREDQGEMAKPTIRH
eukprot:723749-Amorphochlora_amoeboformis.AAC.1